VPHLTGASGRGPGDARASGWQRRRSLPALRRDALGSAFRGHGRCGCSGQDRNRNARDARDSYDHPILASHPLQSPSSRWPLAHLFGPNSKSDSVSPSPSLADEEATYLHRLTQRRIDPTIVQRMPRRMAQRPGPPSSNHPMEVMMSRVITFDRGSKRRMKEIRWKLREVLSAVALSLIVLGLGVLLAFWEVSHYSASPKTHQVTVQH